MRKVILSVVMAASAFISQAEEITIGMDSGSYTLLNQLNATLTGGSILDGNGAIIQLGYYDQAVVGNNFLGTWIPLTGDGSLNTGNIKLDNSGTINLNQTSVGDQSSQGTGDGNFVIQLQFETTNPTKSQGLGGLVANTTPLSIRIYNGTTLASSTHYNTISNDAWTWKTPQLFPNGPNILMTFDEPGTEFQDASGVVPGTSIKTSLVLIPEPSSFALAFVGIVGLATVRRRRAA